MEETKDENQDTSSEYPYMKPTGTIKSSKKPKLRIFLVLIGLLILITLTLYLNPPKANTPVNNSSCIGNTCNITTPIKIDLSEQICSQIATEAQTANITDVRYYYQNPYCIWEASNYTNEYIVKCENENNTLNILVRPITVNASMTMIALESRFQGCNVTELN